ncbi:MAG TPA: substrate-binding domain-containing protein [Actinokineospora sp.]|jgi:simple sugar transport system substrate-binding protein|nr:substrate-binding domain-containing protein [Actinokineospora sp.]
MNRRTVGGLVLAAVTAVSLAGCAASDSSGGAKKGYTIGLVMLQGDEYYNKIQSGLKAAVEADGGTVIAANSNNDAAAEASVVQNMIQRKVDAILMQPISVEGSLATMKQVAAAKIPLICYGNCSGPAVDPKNVQGAVQSDNTALGTGTGKAAAAYIKAKLNGEAKIGVLNCDAAAEVCKMRKAGFKKALDDAGVKVDYVADQEGFLADKATPIATNMLSAHPEITLLWSANEGGTIGEVTAVKQAGKQIPVFGTDISEQLAGFVIAGENILQATTGQDPVKTSELAYAQAKNVISKQQNNPLEVLVPGITYDRAEPAAVTKYLGK